MPPRNLLQRQGPELHIKIDKEKLNYAKAKWLQKRGVNVLAIDKNSEDESRKLFRYIDFDNTGFITKHQIRLFLAFIEGEFGRANSKILEANPVFKSLRGMIMGSEAKIDEAQFSQLMAKDTQKPKTYMPMQKPNRKPGLLDLKESVDTSQAQKQQEELETLKEARARVNVLRENVEALIKRLDDNMKDGTESEEDSPMKNLSKFKN